jgi:hypothetical protein
MSHSLAVYNRITMHDNIFLFTLGEIEERLKKGTLLDVLALAAPLRKLVVESDLVSSVNRKHRKLAFLTTIDPVLEITEKEWLPGRAHPHVLPPRSSVAKELFPTVTLNIAEFLSHPVLATSGRLYTIKNVILTAANMHGAVHIEYKKPPDMPKSIQLPVTSWESPAQIPNSVTTNTATNPLAELKAYSDMSDSSLTWRRQDIKLLDPIARVTLHAMRPLRNDVKQHLRAKNDIQSHSP